MTTDKLRSAEGFGRSIQKYVGKKYFIEINGSIIASGTVESVAQEDGVLLIKLKEKAVI